MGAREKGAHRDGAYAGSERMRRVLTGREEKVKYYKIQNSRGAVGTRKSRSYDNQLNISAFL